jgi:hypothetical protein
MLAWRSASGLVSALPSASGFLRGRRWDSLSGSVLRSGPPIAG